MKAKKKEKDGVDKTKNKAERSKKKFRCANRRKKRGRIRSRIGWSEFGPPEFSAFQRQRRVLLQILMDCKMLVLTPFSHLNSFPEPQVVFSEIREIS